VTDGASERGSSQTAILQSGFIWENAPFPSAHASTVADTGERIAAAWFGGTDEGNPDVGIWFSTFEGGKWTAPVELANGIQPDGKRHPCWNPVLYQAPSGPLVLFYKVGPNPRTWWGMRMESADHGQSWSRPERLPESILGPVRVKPVRLADNSILCGSSTEDRGWRLHMERSPDLGRSWARTPPLNDGRDSGLIQPAILRWPSGRIQILCRSQQGRIYESWMGADWSSWSIPAPIELPNPNSGVDAVVLKDGRALLIYNRTPRGRTPLNIALAREGEPWRDVLVLEDSPGEYSYPAIIQADDGLVHVTYTWKRQRIRHAVIDPAALQ
jgi:predicted neuraminidase